MMKTNLETENISNVSVVHQMETSEPVELVVTTMMSPKLKDLTNVPLVRLDINLMSRITIVQVNVEELVQASQDL
jgi:hypothetical protein